MSDSRDSPIEYQVAEVKMGKGMARHGTRWLRVATLGLVLGCGPGSAAPHQTPLPLASPTVPATIAPTQVPPPTATPEPEPTATEEPPTPTLEPTLEPTVDPTPAPIEAPTLAPLLPYPVIVRPPAATPVPSLAPACPALAPDSVPPVLRPVAAGPRLRPLVVQIDNAIPARPALNLTHAAIVYESVAEGGITRFSAVFTEEDPGLVGPVRSARLISLEVARQLGAVLVYHGASTGVQDALWHGGIDFVSLNDPRTYPYAGRLPSRPVPHNSIVTLPNMRAFAAGQGIPLQVDSWLDFPRGEVPAWPGATGAEVAVGFMEPGGVPAASYRAEFHYRPDTGHYVRSTGGVPDVDAVTGQPVSAETVVIQVAPVLVTDIIEDVLGSRSLDYQLQGEGPAHFFRDGQMWDGCWRRSSAFEPTRFYGPDGQVFAFGDGPVWIAVATPDTPLYRE